MEATSNIEQTLQQDHGQPSTSYPSERLRLVKVHDINLIPRDLFEDSQGELDDSATIDRIYAYGNELLSSPGVIMLGFIDEAGDIQGVLWLEVDPISSVLNCRYIAARPEYRDRNVMWITVDVMQAIAKRFGLERLMGATDRLSENWKRAGWLPLKSQLIYQPVRKEE